VDDRWLHKAVCRQRLELWLTVGHMKLCVDRDLNCVEQSVTKGRTAIYRCTAHHIIQQTVPL